jgi:sulfur-carrier protein
MPRIVFTRHLDGVAPGEEMKIAGETVGEALEAVFETHPPVRHYILDDQGRIRKHIVIFVEEVRLDNASALHAPVGQDSEIYVLQALSGGSGRRKEQRT